MIKVYSKTNKYGIIYGKIDSYNWYALVQDDIVDYGINPNTLAKGSGRVSRLFVYKEVNVDTLNQNTVKDSVIADYRHSWNLLKSDQKELIKKLVNYLELRYSLKVLKEAK
ncbi:hypothetical protein [Thermoanaerobacterium thermosaccharolyticum]|uniref:hypothetical protein n=1 Tax=Thermoanaerobacterium thermosaccharolyticum TaxID=1517 RepID=UPI003DA8A2AF